MYRTAMLYLANPYKIWACGGFLEKRTVLKLTFTDRLVWDRKGMYRTTNLSLTFKVLGNVLSQENQMVPNGGTKSNPESPFLAAWKKNHKGNPDLSDIAFSPEVEELFDTLARWNDYLENHVPEFSEEPQEPRGPEL